MVYLEESLLIISAKEGNRSALEALLKTNYPIVKGFLLKTTLNQQLTEDLTQETMLKAILNFKTYQQTAKFSTWLITIATNLYRDYLRKNKRNFYLDEEQQENKLANQLNLGESPEDMVIDKLEFRVILNSIQKLPEDKRMALVLKHFYGYKYEEIAKIMNCPIGTIRSRIHDALKILRSEVKEGGYNV